MDDTDLAIEIFKKAVIKRSLLYHWHLRSMGHDVESEIEKLEAEVYPQIREGDDQNTLSQRDIDELQLLLCVVDGVSRDENTKAIVYRLRDTVIRVNKEANHQLPHFHIEYKQQHRASYAIDSLERLIGAIPKKYEQPMLDWASRHRKSLRLTWDDLKAGKDVRELVLHAEED